MPQSTSLPPKKKPRELFSHEIIWRCFYDFFLEKGYQLRPRYKPGAKFSNYEERLFIHGGGRLDAIRIADKTKVLLKWMEPEEEVFIRQFSIDLRSEPENRAVPVLEILHPPHRDESVAVLPYLREFDDPQFETLGEVIEAMDQILEGIEFIHKQNVALREIFTKNLVMDTSELIPTGWHYANPHTRDGTRLIQYHPRSRVNMNYYITTFHKATTVDLTPKPPPTAKMIRMYKALGYTEFKRLDPFRVDVWHLGCIFRDWIFSKYDGLDCLKPLLDAMSSKEEADRPVATEARRRLAEIAMNIDPDFPTPKRVSGTITTARRTGLRIDSEAMETSSRLSKGVEAVKSLFSSST